MSGSWNSKALLLEPQKMVTGVIAVTAKSVIHMANSGKCDMAVTSVIAMKRVMRVFIALVAVITLVATRNRHHKHPGIRVLWFTVTHCYVYRRFGSKTS